MNSLISLALTINLASAASHSLRYVHTAVIRVQVTEFSIVGLVDGEQTHYNDIKKKIPNTNTETEIIQNHQDMFRRDVISLMKSLNQTGGVHTVQLMYGCELDVEGTERIYCNYGYDGEDFLSLDLNTLTWTAANAKAVIIKQTWRCDAWAGHVKDYLENECIKCLKTFMKYGRETLERKVRPEVSLFQKDSSSPVVCHATGFFPKSVMIYWQKNGEDLDEDVEIRETLPNQDGTFQKRSILTVSPEELNKHNYTCIIQHSSLEQEMVLQVSDCGVLSDGSLYRILLIAVAAALLIFSLCVVVKECEMKQRREQ